MVNLVDKTEIEKALSTKSDLLLKDAQFFIQYRKKVDSVPQIIFSESLHRAEEKLERQIGYYHGRFYGIVLFWVLEFIDIVQIEFKKRQEELERKTEEFNQKLETTSNIKIIPKGLTKFF